MERVPRELFVPEELRERAYDDAALPIGSGQTISQPAMVALICELLALRGDERVLDVGTGSGYQAAVLAELARGGAHGRAPAGARGARARSARGRRLCRPRRRARRRRDARRSRARALRRDRRRSCGARRAADALRAARAERAARASRRQPARPAARARRPGGRRAEGRPLRPVPLRPARRPRGLRSSAKRVHVTISGRVQGVGFRYATRRACAVTRLEGWVRNNADGTVEAVFEGEPEQVDALVAWCRRGPERRAGRRRQGRVGGAEWRTRFSRRLRGERFTREETPRGRVASPPGQNARHQDRPSGRRDRRPGAQPRRRVRRPVPRRGASVSAAGRPR